MITIPDKVNFQVSGSTVSMSGPNGKLSKTFNMLTAISASGREIRVEGEKAIASTVESVISSMAKGVTEGYRKELKIIYAHFPISLEVKGKDLMIKNFQGEKQPRRSKIIGDTKIAVKGQAVTISGTDKEAVGQTIANIRAATRIKEKDSRVFQDGIYEIEV